jgi:hypothetical protein
MSEQSQRETMKVNLVMVVALSILGSCAKRSSPTVTEIEMSPVEVGTKTPDYEVIAPNALKLAPGVRIEIVKGADGQQKGFVLMRQNVNGGFMSCGCGGATTNNCVTENDNPDHPSCSGGCTDSEGNPHPCGLIGPIIGPPRDPFRIKIVPRRKAN